VQPSSDQVNSLNLLLQSLHGPKLTVLAREAQKFSAYINTLAGFRITNAGFSSDQKHLGRVIVDAVLQVGHDYEKQVRPAVQRILGFSQAVTVSGFIELLQGQPLKNLINFSSEGIKEDLLSVAQFFANGKVETYDDLYTWLQLEQNRDALLTANSGLQGKVFTIGEKTADYFRVLVRHWDAVAVDRGIRGLLDGAGIISKYSKKYAYKELRSIVQLAATQHLGCRPVDLDASIYDYYVSQKPATKRRKYKSSNSKFCIYCGQQLPRVAKYCSQCGRSQS